ncbi:MAG: N-acetylmuramoyl-L-alanine amidase [Ignavibacteriae bacterium]|nr:N-acetylmuramoyl-L-alanine amidase [Ignavibacteriota bacterium]
MSFFLFSCKIRRDNFKVIERKKWDKTEYPGNKSIYKYKKKPSLILKYIVVHHSAFSDSPSPAKIQKHQVDKLGFSEIAYHFIIDRAGQVFEGRSILYMGAHAGQTKEANQKADSIRAGKCKSIIENALMLDPDYGAIGICIDGNFNFQYPNSSQLLSLQNLLVYLMNKFDIKKKNILLHKEVKKRLIENKGLTFIGEETECPGNLGVPLINSILSKL